MHDHRHNSYRRPYPEHHWDSQRTVYRSKETITPNTNLLLPVTTLLAMLGMVVTAAVVYTQNNADVEKKFTGLQKEVLFQNAKLSDKIGRVSQAVADLAENVGRKTQTRFTHEDYVIACLRAEILNKGSFVCEYAPRVYNRYQYGRNPRKTIKNWGRSPKGTQQPD